VEVAEAGLLDPHLHQPVERGAIRDRPRDGLDEPVDARLIVGLDDREGGPCPREHLVELERLLAREGFGCRCNHDISVQG
jgi:hypothetical protein